MTPRDLAVPATAVRDRPAPRRDPVRAMAQRLSWGLGDQAVSSLTNFFVGVVVAHSVSPAYFGIFTLAWITYGVVLNVSRGLTSDPLVVRFSGVPDASWRAAVAAASGTALVLGVLAGGASVLAGAMIGGQVGHAFVALGLVLPGLMLQDTWRFACFAAGHGRKAFLNDLTWGVALVPALLLAVGQRSVFGFVLAWGLAGAVAAGYGCLQTGIVPSLHGIGGWLRQHRDLGPRYLVENVSNSGAVQLRMYGLGAIAGVSDVGALRGAELLLGPFLMVLMGLTLFAVPEASRLLREAPHRLPRFCLLLGGGQAVTAATWGLMLLFLLPDSVGRAVLDDVWDLASPLILPVSISVTGAGLVAGAAAGLRALGAARRSVRAQLFASAGYVGGGLTGAAIAGALGSSWGSATAMWCGAVVWWLQFRAAMNEHTMTMPRAGQEEIHTP